MKRIVRAKSPSRTPVKKKLQGGQIVVPVNSLETNVYVNFTVAGNAITAATSTDSRLTVTTTGPGTITLAISAQPSASGITLSTLKDYSLFGYNGTTWAEIPRQNIDTGGSAVQVYGSTRDTVVRKQAGTGKIAGAEVVVPTASSSFGNTLQFINIADSIFGFTLSGTPNTHIKLVFTNTYQTPSTKWTGWLPTSIPGLTLWLDGLEPATNVSIPNDKTAIPNWKDKSGRNNHASTGTLPTFAFNTGATGANKGGIYFNGSTSFSGTMQNDNNYCAIFAVIGPDLVAQNAARVLSMSSAAGTSDSAGTNTSASVAVTSTAAATSTQIVTSNSSVSATSYAVDSSGNKLCVTSSWINNTSACVLVNGVILATFTGSIATPANAASSTLTVTAVAAGIITIGMVLSGASIPANTVVIAQLTGPIGGEGDYTVILNTAVSGSAQLVASTTITGVSTTPISATANPNMNLKTYSIGKNNSNANFYIGFVHEVIVYTQPVTKIGRQTVEGYLAWKWGITLNAAHPFAAAAPTAGAPVLPTPIIFPNIKPLVWLDGQDPLANEGSTFPENSTSITGWYDKSGKNNHAVTLAKFAPTYLANSIVFNRRIQDATQSPTYLYSPISTPITKVIHAFIICTNSGTNRNITSILSMASNTTKETYSAATQAAPANIAEDTKNASYIGLYNDNGYRNIYRNGLVARTVVADNAVRPPELLYFSSNETTISLRVGGNTAITTTGTFPYFNIGAYGLGLQPSNINRLTGLLATAPAAALNYAYDGSIYEVIIYTTDLTSLQYQLLEGYLGSKWGITLAATHPYYLGTPAQYSSTAPTAIGTMTFTNITATGFTLSWTGGANATSYKYSITPTTDNGVSNNSAVFTLPTNVTNTITVTPSNSAGDGTAGTATLLKTPAGPTISGLSGSGFTVTIPAIAGAVSYNIYLNGTKYIPSSSSGNDFTIGSLSPGITYLITITAVSNTGQESMRSPPVTVITPPPAPTNFRFSAVTSTSFVLYWTGGVGATSYTYSISPSVANQPSTDKGVDSKYAMFTGLDPNTSYIVTVTANIGALSSAPGISQSQMTLMPGVARNLGASSIVYNGFNLTFTGSAGAGISYRVYIGGVALSPQPATVSPTGTAISWPTPGALLSVTVTIVAGGAETGPSNPLSVQLPPSDPTGLTYTILDSNTVTVSWGGASGATGYTYNGASILTDNGVASKSVKFGVMVPTTTYSFGIQGWAGNVSSVSNRIWISILNAPTTITSSAITTTGFTVTIGAAVNNAASYNIYVNGVNTATITAPSLSTVVTVPAALNGTLLRVTAVSVNSSGLEGWPFSGYYDKVIAGISGTQSTTGDGGAATSATLNTYNSGISLAYPGYLYFNNVGYTRAINFADGTINKITNNLPSPYKFDAVDKNGNMYFFGSNNISMLDINGNTTIVAGGANSNQTDYISMPIGVSGGPIQANGISATSVGFPTGSNIPNSIAIDNSLNIFLSDSYFIWKVNCTSITAGGIPTFGTITLISGNSGGLTKGFSGDSGQAFAAQINFPNALAIDSSNNLYFNDYYNYRIRKITAISGTVTPQSIIKTIAGNGYQAGIAGNIVTPDGSVATNASIGGASRITSIAIDSSGNIYYPGNKYGGGIALIFKISSAGIVSAIAGTGYTFIIAQINKYSLAVDSNGVVYMYDSGYFTIRTLSPYLVIQLLVSAITSLVVQSPFTATGFTLSWAGATGAVTYTFTGATPTSFSVASKTATFSGLTVTQAYTIGVTGVNGTVNSGATSITIPAAPSALAATAVTSSQFTLTFTGTVGATTHKIYNAGSLMSPQPATISPTGTTITGGAGQSFTITITGVVGGIEMWPSSALTVQLIPSTPTTFTTNNFTPTGFDLRWQGGSPATSGNYTCTPANTPTVDAASSNYATFVGFDPAIGASIIVRVNNGATVSLPATATIAAAPSGGVPTGTGLTVASVTHQGFIATISTPAVVAGLMYNLYVDGVRYTLATGSATAAIAVSAMPTPGAVVQVKGSYSYGGTEGFQSVTSNAVQLAPAPVTSVAIVAGSMSSTGFQLTWQGGTGATSYTFTGAQPASYDAVAKTATFSGLLSTSSYTIGVTGVAGGTSSVAGSITLTAGPTGLSATAITSTQFTLTFTAVAGATSYKVYDGGILISPQPASIAAAGTTITGAGGQAFSITLSAIISGVETRPSNSLSVQLPPTPVTSVVSVAGSASATGFQLSWQGGVGSTSYTFTGVTPASYDMVAKTATFSGLVSTSAYTIGIKGVAGGTSSVAGSITLTAGPTGLSATAITSSQFTLKFTAVAGATSYKVYDGGILISPQPASILAAGTTITGAGGRAFNITLSAIISGVETRPSLALSVLLKPQDVTSVVILPGSVSNTGFQLTWQGGNGATSYTFTGAPVGVGLTASYDLAAKTATITVLNLSTAYTLTVTPINSSGSGTPGTVAVPIYGIINMNCTISGSTITVTWNGALETVTSYNYTITPNVDNQPSTDNGVSAKTAIFTGLTIGTQYVITATPVVGATVYTLWAASITIAADPGVPTITGSTGATNDIQTRLAYAGTGTFNVVVSDPLGIGGATPVTAIMLSSGSGSFFWPVGGVRVDVTAYLVIGDINGWKTTYPITVRGMVGTINCGVTKNGTNMLRFSLIDTKNYGMTYTLKEAGTAFPTYVFTTSPTQNLPTTMYDVRIAGPGSYSGTFQSKDSNGLLGITKSWSFTYI